MNYTLSAFGYELIVSQTGEGSWVGGYREAGSKGSYTPVNESGYPDARSAQFATCKAVQALALQVDETVMDPCTEALSGWVVE